MYGVTTLRQLSRVNLLCNKTGKAGRAAFILIFGIELSPQPPFSRHFSSTEKQQNNSNSITFMCLARGDIVQTFTPAKSCPFFDMWILLITNSAPQAITAAFGLARRPIYATFSITSTYPRERETCLLAWGVRLPPVIISCLVCCSSLLMQNDSLFLRKKRGKEIKREIATAERGFPVPIMMACACM